MHGQLIDRFLVVVLPLNQRGHKAINLPIAQALRERAPEQVHRLDKLAVEEEGRRCLQLELVAADPLACPNADAWHTWRYHGTYMRFNLWGLTHFEPRY